jgi:drug/metabolite transporter (DMT)-like permease
MSGSAFFFALLDMFIKMIGPSFRAWDIAFYRFGFGFFALLMLFGWGKNLFTGHNTKLLVVRGITGSITFLCLVSAVRLIPISTAMVLFYSFPAFSALFSFLLFKETLTRSEIFCILIAFSGVAVLFDVRLEGALAGQTLGIISGFFAGLTISLIKKLREKNGPVIIYLYFCLFGALATFPRFIVNPQIPANHFDWLMLVGIMFSSLFAQLLMNQGFKYCKSWEGGLFLTSEVIFTSLFGISILGEKVTWRFWLGGLLILASVVALNQGHARRLSYRGLGDSLKNTACLD